MLIDATQKKYAWDTIENQEEYNKKKQNICLNYKESSSEETVGNFGDQE